MVYNESKEMYLETILVIKNRKGSVRAIDIANALDYSKPSVSRAVGLLKNDGYLTVDSDGNIRLTESGKEKAENVFLRHKILTETFVKIGLSRDVAVFKSAIEKQGYKVTGFFVEPYESKGLFSFLKKK